jgi:site-specific recombinase XerD
LFTSPVTGKYYSTEFLRKLWKEKKPHTVTLYEAMRHSFCTQIVGAADIATAKALMRHSDIRSTEAYLHQNPVRFKSVVNNRGKVIAITETRLKRQEQ